MKIKSAVSIVMMTTVLLLSCSNNVLADNDQMDGTLKLNDAVIQQRQANTTNGTVTKAEQTMPDLFDPRYTKGLKKDSNQDIKDLNQQKNSAFQTKRIDKDETIVTNKKVTKGLFKKQITTNKTANSKIATTDAKNGPGIVIGAIIIFSGLGILVGLKGQKLLFRKRRN